MPLDHRLLFLVPDKPTKKLSALLPQQGPLNSYLVRWKEITSDPKILNVMLRCQIPFLSVPVQLDVPLTKCSD